MERISFHKNSVIQAGVWLVRLGPLWVIVLTWALNTQAAPSRGNDRFPESRFGEAPANPVSGKIEKAIVNEAEYWDSLAVQSSATGRTPASESSNDPGSKITPTQTQLDSEIRKKGLQEVAIIASELGFFPKMVFVNAETPVRFYITGSSKKTLCLMMDSFQIRRQVVSQKVEELTFTPKVPGRYRFYCPVNGMEGTLVVRESPIQLLGETHGGL